MLIQIVIRAIHGVSKNHRMVFRAEAICCKSIRNRCFSIICFFDEKSAAVLFKYKCFQNSISRYTWVFHSGQKYYPIFSRLCSDYIAFRNLSCQPVCRLGCNRFKLAVIFLGVFFADTCGENEKCKAEIKKNYFSAIFHHFSTVKISSLKDKLAHIARIAAKPTNHFIKRSLCVFCVLINFNVCVRIICAARNINGVSVRSATPISKLQHLSSNNLGTRYIAPYPVIVFTSRFWSSSRRTCHKIPEICSAPPWISNPISMSKPIV